MPGIYHDYSTCNKCGSDNDVMLKDSIEGFICECATKCSVCGFEDYWAYGFFESSAEGYNKCEKYGSVPENSKTV